MSISLLVFIRSVVAFIVLFVFTRIIGKQQMSQLTVFEYLVGITIGSIASAMSIELEIESINGIVGMAVWAFIPICLAIIGLKSPMMRRYIEGEPRVLIRNGRIVDHNLRKERIDLDQLLMLLRQKNVFSISDVEFAILEVNGQLSVLPKASKLPVTPYDLHLPVQNQELPASIIKDGVVNHQRLVEEGLDSVWLTGKLKERGVEDVSQVMYAQLNGGNELYVDIKDEWKENLNPGMDRILTAIYQLHADFHQYSLLSENPKARKDYMKMKNQMDKMIKLIQNHVAQNKS